MKFTVEGFSQKVLVEIGLNLEETLLLRWFIDFQSSGSMKKIHNADKEYCWVNYQAVSDDLPIIASNKYKVSRLFESMVEKGIFERFTYRVGGVYSTFRIMSEVYEPLIKDVPSSNSARRVQAEPLEGSSNSARTNNSSTNQSTKETSEDAHKKRKRKNPSKIDKGEYKPYGEHNKVFFFDTEYGKLVSEHGEAVIKTAIDIVDGYLTRNPDKSYTDFVRVFHSWAIEEAEKKVKQSSFQNSSSLIISTAPEPEIICCGQRYSFNLGFCPQCGKKYNREGKEI